MTKFIISLADKLRKNGVSETTISNYSQIIKQLFTSSTGKPNNKITSLTFLRDIEKVLDTIKTYEKSSQKTYIATIMKILNISGIKYEQLYKTYRAKYDDLSSKMDAISNEKTPKQKENWTSIDALKDVQQKYKELVDEWFGDDEITMKQYNDLLSYLIVSLYLEIPPQRSQDFYKMVLVDNIKDAVKEDRNYYAKKDKSFIFFQYKTASSDEGRGEPVKIPKSLSDIIDRYLEYRPETADCFIAKYNGGCFKIGADWSRRVKEAFSRFTDGKAITSQLLRNIYNTERFSKSNAEKKDVAKKMKTSVAMIDKVYTKSS